MIWVENLYNAQCADCRWSWHSKNAPLSTLTRATSHALKRMHRVTVTRGPDVVETIDPTQGQEIIYGGVDAAPF